MATNSDGEPTVDSPIPRSTPQVQAQTALDGLETDRAKLAERVVTPWWYHPVLGAILAVVVAAYALPSGYPLLVVAPGLVAMVLLVRAYSRRYGVAVTGSFGPRTRRLQIAVGVIVGSTIAAAFILNITGASVAWTLVPMAVVLCGIIVLGRRYDEALRGELARRDGVRA